MKLWLDQGLHLYLLNFSLLASAAILNAPPTSPLELINSSSSSFELLLNTTQVDSVNPENFKIHVAYGLRPLPMTSVLLVALDALVQLALQDWESQMTAKAFKLEEQKYSHVELRIAPSNGSDGATLKSAFAVLGVFELMKHILANPTQRFKPVECTFKYNEQEVGRLTLNSTVRSNVPPADSEGSLLGSFTLPSSLSQNGSVASTFDPFRNNEESLSSPAWADSRLRLGLLRGSATFTMLEIFMGVYIELRDLAPQRATDRLVDFNHLIQPTIVTSADNFIDVHFRNAGNPPRTAADPPFFKYEWLIKGLGRFPAMMLEYRDLRDFFHIDFEVDRISVGRGYFKRAVSGRQRAIART